MIAPMGGLFRVFHGAIKVSDGGFGEYTSARTIICREKGGRVKELTTNGEVIIGCKYRRGQKILEHMVIDRFHRGFTQYDEEAIPGPVVCQYRRGNWRQVLHGPAVRKNVRLFGIRGTCRTLYSCGRFVSQEFRYDNRHLAYRLRSRDRAVIIKYPDGRTAGVVEVSRGGFNTVIRKDRTVDYSYSGRRATETVSVRDGRVVFPFAEGFHLGDGVDRFDFSKTGNCKIQFWDRLGRTRFKGEYRDRQRVGEWLINGKRCYIINGVEVSKKLWDTPPAKINLTAVLRIKNIQLRAALIARAGYARLCNEVRNRVVHEDTRRKNKLLEFPAVKVDDGNGGRESKLRILQVRCPSTKENYFLNVPDFVWDGGQRTKLNTCEAARQWTFGNDNPRERIQFALET